MTTETINLAQKFSLFAEHWKPKIIGDINDSYVKLVKVQGEFVWHHHDNEDELFLVIQGSLKIKLEDKTLIINEGELVIIPRGVEHCPVAEQEAHILLLEPKSTVNTGSAPGDRTVSPERI